MKLFWPFYIVWCASWLSFNFAIGAPAWQSAMQAFFLGVALTMVAVERRWVA